MLDPDQGTDEAYESVILAPRNTERAIQLALWKTGKRMLDEVSRQMLEKNKTGTLYKFKGRRSHRASGPGQTPANMTGRMRKARTFKIRGTHQLEVGFSGAPYARNLEEGTKNMSARPGLKNTIKAEEKNTENEFIKYLERQLT